MSTVLGINAFHADSSACIVKNGKIIAAIEEERINRIKHWAGFPNLSIRECLKISGISPNDISDVAVNTNPKSNLIPKINFFLKNLVFGKKKFEIIKRYKNKLYIKDYLKLENINNVKIHYINHHISHISSSYYLSNLEKATGLSIDGSGDFSSLMIAECLNNKIEIKKQIYFPNSLGIFYEAMTQFLGFNNYGDEYKLMGLAPYGKPRFLDFILNNILNINNNFFSLNLSFFNHQKSSFEYKFDGKPKQKTIYSDKLLKIFDNEERNSLEFKKDFAASIQKAYEAAYVKILELIKKLNISENIVFAGGCALNSSANNILINDKYFKKVFIPCSPGDGGGAIGAALHVASSYSKIDKLNLSPYLGSIYNRDEIENILSKYNDKLETKYYKNEEILFDVVTSLLIEQKVIGWFQDRMEFGPRALGNRSILADPRSKKMKDIINKKIKRRESFRPFAPSILSEKKSEWYEENKFENIYMSSVEVVRSEKKELIPSVTHVDNTGRVQLIKKDINLKFYKLVKKFYEKTKVPILLNTSFNENEPIVRSPEEAINCLLRTDMDNLIIENFVIKKKK